jgi:hypothetical protein
LQPRVLCGERDEKIRGLTGQGLSIQSTAEEITKAVQAKYPWLTSRMNEMVRQQTIWDYSWRRREDKRELLLAFLLVSMQRNLKPT